MEEKFFLTAESTLEFAADGKPLEYHFITVRVKDSDGNPVKGLKKSDFIVYDTGSVFSKLNIKLVQELKEEGPSLPFLEGTYRLRIDRLFGLKGQFVYAVMVVKKPKGRHQSGGGSGQTLLSVVKVA